MPTATKRAEYVKRGAELLDQVKPDWREHINPDTLNVMSSLNCILGQTYGGYVQGVIELELSSHSRVTYGFYPEPDFCTYGDMAREADALTEEWRRYLAESAALVTA